jgi:ABC-type glycerol-3-phosphate transport system permease component
MTRPSAWHRFGRWVAARGWAHLLLLTAAAIFLYPFLWMVSISIKTDEELADNAAPELPSFLPASPYVRPPPKLDAPEGASEATWRRLEPALLRQAQEVTKAALPEGVPVDAEAWARSAAAVLTQQAIARVPRTAWAGEGESALAAFASNLTPDGAADALNDRLARLELQDLQVRTNDARIVTIASGADIATSFRVVSGDAKLVPTAAGARLDYRFDSASDAPLVLECEVKLPDDVAPADVHKLILGLRCDNSWHRVEAEIGLGTTTWRSTRSTPLAQNRPTTVVFQPPSFDDQTFRARTWVPLREAGHREVPPGMALKLPGTLRVSVAPSSTLRALWEKAGRNYDRAFQSVPFWTYVGNSVVLVALIVCGSMFSSAFVAYAFARLRWPGRSIALIVLLSTMMLPGQVTMIPSFLIFRELGWYNTLNPLWIGAWLGNAFFIFLMIQHLRTIPKELEEAARIDGLNALQTWWYIIVPLVKPILAAIAIMSFQGAWNEFMGPLIYLRDQSRFPLSLGLFGMRVDQGGDFAMMMAGSLLMTLPSILVFFCFQRYFIQGMTVSGMKA